MGSKPLIVLAAVLSGVVARSLVTLLYSLVLGGSFHFGSMQQLITAGAYMGAGGFIACLVCRSRRSYVILGGATGLVLSQLGIYVSTAVYFPDVLRLITPGGYVVQVLTWAVVSIAAMMGSLVLSDFVSATLNLGTENVDARR